MSFLKRPSYLFLSFPNDVQSMLEDVRSHKLTVEVSHDRTFVSTDDMVDEAKRLGCDTVINCVGLAAADLCQDNELIGARGILMHFDRQSTERTFVGEDGTTESLQNDAVIAMEDGQWASDGYPCYLIPRRDLLVVGGSYLENDTETTIRPEERERLLRYATTLGIDPVASPPIGEWVGSRPYRPTTRCGLDEERTEKSGLTFIHNYGHGGSGWTIATGVAREVASLIV